MLKFYPCTSTSCMRLVMTQDKVMVTHIESPTCFWAQVVGNQLELLQIVENLGAVCPSATALAGQPLMEKVTLILLQSRASFCQPVVFASLSVLLYETLPCFSFIYIYLWMVLQK